MSAEVLRRAAALMRGRAEAAPAGSPWAVASSRSSHRVTDNLRPGVAMAVADVFPTGGSEHQRHMAEHIASWHPAVALAVADWLDSVAHDFDENTILDAPEAGEGHWPNPDALWCDYCGGAIESPNYAAGDQRCKCERWSRALAVARTYLGDADV